jgi:hypothetical protein
MKLTIAVVTILIFGCAAKPTASTVCKKIEAAGIGSGCSQVKPEVINARAKTKFDFDLVRVPGEKGAVLDFTSDDDYLATVNAYATAAMLAGPHRYGNASTRIFVQLNTGASLEEGNLVKAIVDGAAVPTMSSASASPSASPSSRPEPLHVKAKDLYDEYQKNGVAADEKYKGTVLFITGEVCSIDKDSFDKMVIELNAGADSDGTVHAQMRESEKASVITVAKKQLLVLRCEGGEMVLKTPSLKNCIVVIDNLAHWLDRHRGDAAAADLKEVLLRAMDR